MRKWSIHIFLGIYFTYWSNIYCGETRPRNRCGLLAFQYIVHIYRFFCVIVWLYARAARAQFTLSLCPKVSSIARKISNPSAEQQVDNSLFTCVSAYERKKKKTKKYRKKSNQNWQSINTTQHKDEYFRDVTEKPIKNKRRRRREGLSQRRREPQNGNCVSCVICLSTCIMYFKCVYRNWFSH